MLESAAATEGRLKEFLRGPADEAVGPGLTAEERLARVRAALRVRGYVSELNRKNAELAAVSERFERLARRMENELRLASHVQRSLMPLPCTPRFEMAREFIPFREIGGDFYDVVVLAPDRIAFAIGDVMGKGVPAALLAASLKACLRAQLLAGASPPEDLVGRVNRLFCEVSPQGLFASLLRRVRSQLLPVRLRQRGAPLPAAGASRWPVPAEDLVAGGTVLGLLENASYESRRVQLEPKDLLVFYSDGVTDRHDVNGDDFGHERLREAALRVRHDSARIALYTLLGEVQGFSAGCPPNDDMTLWWRA